MQLLKNKPLRNLGVYKLHDQTFILLKRSEELSFLFSSEHWYLHGPVDYRVSHGEIYCHGDLTSWTDEDLIDMGTNAKPIILSTLLNGRKI